jgi:serine/threonine-protein kinase
MSGDTIGNYRLVREIGAGGMGTVYEALDLMLERTVAIKMLRPEIAGQPELVERFRTEAVTLAKLNHPAIATLYALIREEGRLAMVMEFVRGRSLDSVLAGAGRLDTALAAHLICQTLEGIAHAHSQSVLHRDIKPGNIMLTGERDVKVTDFGIARILGAARMTRAGNVIGTLEFIAPERIRGDEEDPRSDLYSAGVVLFELLAGRLPFLCDTDFSLMQAHLQEPPPTLASLGVPCPPPIQAVLGKALAKDPKERFQSAREFRDELAAAATTAPVPALTAAAQAPTRLPGVAPARLADSAQAPVSAPALPKPGLPDWARAGVIVAAAAVLFGGLYYLKSRLAAAPASPPATASAPVTPSGAAPPSAPPAGQVPAPGAAGTPALPPPAGQAGSSSGAAAIPPHPGPAEALPRPPNLHGVKRLYVAKMAEDLDKHIRDEIREKLPKLRLAGRRADADAVMEASTQRRGGAARATAGMKSDFAATARITDFDGTNLLWSAEAGDARALVGAFKRGGPKLVAERLVENLKKTLERPPAR